MTFPSWTNSILLHPISFPKSTFILTAWVDQFVQHFMCTAGLDANPITKIVTLIWFKQKWSCTTHPNYNAFTCLCCTVFINTMTDSTLTLRQSCIIVLQRLCLLMVEGVSGSEDIASPPSPLLQLLLLASLLPGVPHHIRSQLYLHLQRHLLLGLLGLAKLLTMFTSSALPLKQNLFRYRPHLQTSFPACSNAENIQQNLLYHTEELKKNGSQKISVLILSFVLWLDFLEDWILISNLNFNSHWI